MTPSIQFGLFALHVCFISSVKGARNAYAADMILLVDNSGSVFNYQMKIIQDTMKKLPNYLNISQDEVHIGVVVYGTGAEIELPLTRNVSVYMHYLQTWKRRVLGGTETHLGYKKAMEALRNSTRDDVPKHVVLLTDGESSPMAEAESVAEELRDSNITIHILYVGERSVTALEHMKKMAGNPSHVYSIKSHQTFLETFQKVIHDIIEEDLCLKCTTDVCPAQCTTIGPMISPDSATGTKGISPQQPTGDPFQSPDSVGPADRRTVSKMSAGRGNNDGKGEQGGARWGLIGGLIGSFILLILIVTAVLITRKKNAASAAALKQLDKGASVGKKQTEKVGEINVSNRKSVLKSTKDKVYDKEKAATGSNLKDIERNLQVSLMESPKTRKSVMSQKSKKSYASQKEKLAQTDASTEAKGVKTTAKVAGKPSEKADGKSAKAK